MVFKHIFIALLILLFPSLAITQTTIKVPYSTNPIVFKTTNWSADCKRKILVNNQIVSDTFQTLGILSPTLLEIRKGDSITVSITDSCATSSTNFFALPDDALNERKSIITSLTIDSSGFIYWLHRASVPNSFYTVEMYIWNKWVKMDTVYAVNIHSISLYQTKLKLTSGLNNVRVQYWEKDRSAPLKTVSTSIERPILSFDPIPQYPEKLINFGHETYYEIYDMYGVLVTKGIASFVKIDTFRKGQYFLYYANKQAIFTLK